MASINAAKFLRLLKYHFSDKVVKVSSDLNLPISCKPLTHGVMHPLVKKKLAHYILETQN